MNVFNQQQHSLADFGSSVNNKITRTNAFLFDVSTPVLDI